MTKTVHTKSNTAFVEWLKKALAEFRRLGLPAPTMEAVYDAYQVGESPETWASYVANS